MEEPKKMTSTILETPVGLSISTPKSKSWALIIFLSLITVQFTNGIIQSIFFAHDMPIVGRLVILILSTIIVYYTLKGLLWQLTGVRKIEVSGNELKLSKSSPLWTRTKTYRLPEIKAFDVRNETISEGPAAMLQLLKITDKIQINFTYGYETITATRGIDQTEAIVLKELLTSKIIQR